MLGYSGWEDNGDSAEFFSTLVTYKKKIEFHIHSLIPKKPRANDSNDFKLISLYNVVY